ncbi:MAG: hypothetical protein KAI45_12405 [Melioribacteraceae bacterium]|nr:hypothetical protein [Melioribacteraceae bacterium]
MIKYIFTYLLFLFIVVHAQDSVSIFSSESKFVKADSIEISGNKRTKEYVILRELTFAPGDSVNSEVLEFNKNRIFSLGIFTRVDLNIEQQANLNKIVITVQESWYIFPVPFINVPEKTFKRVSYGIRFVYMNFRGRNETLRATLSFGFDPVFSLSYENPLIIPSADISFLLSGAYSTPINKSPTADSIHGGNFDYMVGGGQVSFGKRLNLSNDIYFTLGYSYVETPLATDAPIMASGTPIDRSFIAGMSYIFDTRNLKQYANRGFYILANYLYKGIGNRDIEYSIIDLDMRNYRKIVGDLIFKYRAAGRHTFGNKVPLYDYSILGYSYFTRGNRYLVREGNNALIGSIELGYPLLSEWNFNIDLPIIPNRLTRARIAIIFNIFADAATTFNNGDKVVLNDFNSGYGVGFTFLIMPYMIFRTEFALNEMGKGEFLLESGISF